MDLSKKKLSLGIIGLSVGNGHPYSWSAIFNGFESNIMNECPFPAIPAYLSEQNFPEDFLCEYGNVKAIWTQEMALSLHIAEASHIQHVCEEITDLVGRCDAILLARDDAARHIEMAGLFLEQGIPIFIDKPFALSRADAEKMLSAQQYDSQIFTCSALRYSDELHLKESDIDEIGEVFYIEAYCPKYWDTYSVHLIEPILVNCEDRGELISVSNEAIDPWHVVSIRWKSLGAKIHMTKDSSHSIEIVFHGKKGKVTKQFHDSFNSFKKSLLYFVEQVRTKKQLIPRKETLEIISIIEYGR